MLTRYSSRLERLDHLFLRDKLRQAKSYRRIAGYFRSSLLELVYEELDAIDEVRIVCNADLDPKDLRVAQLRQAYLKEKWNERPPEAESLLSKERYQRLFELLMRGNVQIRVVGRGEAPFVHGKAGVIDLRDGSQTSFIGSVNETADGWRDHYEIVWEDRSPEGVAWVDAEFDWLWSQGIPLDQVVLDEIERFSKRREFKDVAQCPPKKLPAAIMAEAPLYRRGEKLLSYQQAFVGMFLEHREIFGKARLLLADEVGLGKTLSLATSAVVSSLLDDGPVLIACPSNLRFQWQTELLDKLGVPTAVWTVDKTWADPWGHTIRTRGAEDVARCPYQIGIVSTGLLFRKDSAERHHLLSRNYGTLILDEAHRARRAGGLGKNAGEPNNLLSFMREAAKRAKNVLLGTATPIQTDIVEIWDLLDVLGQGAEFVLGRPPMSRWPRHEEVLPLITGAKSLEDEGDVWDLVRNPLPPKTEGLLFDAIRMDLGLSDKDHFTARSVFDLDLGTREDLFERAGGKRDGLSFFQRHNPIVRHTVLRKRRTLEERGLIPKVGVDIHPSGRDVSPHFAGLGLLTSPEFDEAYRAAEHFTALVAKRTKSAGFLKSLLLQRICSSVAAGLGTAHALLKNGVDASVEDESESDSSNDKGLHPLSVPEREALGKVISALEQGNSSEELESGRVSAIHDPKRDAVMHYLIGRQPRWLDYGCIVFSQYYDTARSIADSLAARLPGEPIALYAGAGKSRLFKGGEWNHIERTVIQKLVKERVVRLLVATDAACEGLNLQTLGTLINVDLPWNPSRLEQRIGRIKRFGQTRESVDMLNLVYHGTRDEDVYERLSQRMKDRFDLFGSLPDVIDDDWIDDIENLSLKLDAFIANKKKANAFDIRYSDTVDPKGEPWEKCTEVLSRQDVTTKLSRGW